MHVFTTNRLQECNWRMRMCSGKSKKGRNSPKRLRRSHRRNTETTHIASPWKTGWVVPKLLCRSWRSHPISNEIGWCSRLGGYSSTVGKNWLLRPGVAKPYGWSGVIRLDVVNVRDGCNYCNLTILLPPLNPSDSRLVGQVTCHLDASPSFSLRCDVLSCQLQVTCLLENAVPALWPAACDRPAWLKLHESEQVLSDFKNKSIQHLEKQLRNGLTMSKDRPPWSVRCGWPLPGTSTSVASTFAISSPWGSLRKIYWRLVSHNILSREILFSGLAVSGATKGRISCQAPLLCASTWWSSAAPGSMPWIWSADSTTWPRQSSVRITSRFQIVERRRPERPMPWERCRRSKACCWPWASWTRVSFTCRRWSATKY